MRRHTRLDREIQETMTKAFPLPEKVKNAQDAAFARIRDMQDQKGQVPKAMPAERKNSRDVFFKTCAGLAAAAAVFLVICIADPAFAAQIPLVGRVFETLGDSLDFSGDHSGYAEPLGEGSGDTEADDPGQGSAVQGGDTLYSYSQTKNGMTITLSEVYCNDAALYISMVLESEEGFPETMCDQEGDPCLHLWESKIKFDYNLQEDLFAASGSDSLDGRFLDDHTYAGVIRFDLSASEEAFDRAGYEKEWNRFIQTLGITEQELEEDPAGAYERACQILGIADMTDESLARVGGPKWEDYKKEVEVPDSFKVKLSIPMVAGDKADPDTPEMPGDLRAAYEQAMRENGLGLTDEAYEGFTDEQKEIEHQLFTKMWNGYGERFPETKGYPNKYENWWVEGPWEFSLDVDKNSEGTVVKEIGDVDDKGLGLVSVTKTPFEIIIDDGQPGADYFTVALDADGDILDYGGSSNSSTDTFAIQDRDVSKIDVYICDYIEYMDELKVYYWSEDYEEKKKKKTFKQLLDERALYHKEVVFGQ